MLKAIGRYMVRLADLRESTDTEATISSIEHNIEFRGVTMWQLACAIIIASVGLNINSTAVIIGAMLISPLMGPINGIGLSLGIMDLSMLHKAVRNLFVMVLISLLASTLYFVISPLSDAQSELLARTSPSLYDALIAFFGGLIGILAQSRKQQSMTAISGVAIATALMPPLCTAGYGLATLNFTYFTGAFYLFFINSFFIALATYLMVRYLHFPCHQYIHPERERLMRMLAISIAVVTIIPSGFTAVRMIQKASFDNSAIKYIEDVTKEVEGWPYVTLIGHKHIYDASNGSVIRLSFIGKELTEEQNKRLSELRNEYFPTNTLNPRVEKIEKGISETVETPLDVATLLKALEQRDSTIIELRLKLAEYERQDSTASGGE